MRRSLAGCSCSLRVSKRSNYNRVMPRKVILGFGISMVGYIARRNGAMDYLVKGKEGEALMGDFFAKIDTTIMGRKTAAEFFPAKQKNVTHVMIYG